MAETQDTAPKTSKSIIAEKYRDGRYKKADWLGATIGEVVNTTTERTKKVPVEGQEGAFKEVTETVSDGVNVDRLFRLARENGLNVDKYEAQRNSHGFQGRFRMTVRNMLQAVAKQRHGIIINGEFVAAPAGWLAEKKAPEMPTHTKTGEKIAKPKPEKAPEENAGAAQSDGGDAKAPAKPKGAAKPAPAAKAK